MYERGIVSDPIGESHIDFHSYKEGIVELFNRFCSEAQRRYGEDLGYLTPRELQQNVIEKISEGAYALEDLVTAFEAANYSKAEPMRKDFERCRAAVDVLIRFMDDMDHAEKPGKMPEERTDGKSLEETSIKDSSIENRRENQTNLLRGFLCFSALFIFIALLYFTQIEFKSYIDKYLQIFLSEIRDIGLVGS